MFRTEATSHQGDRKQHAVLQNKISITLLQKGKSFLTRDAFSSLLAQFAALHPSWITKQDITPPPASTERSGCCAHHPSISIPAVMHWDQHIDSTEALMDPFALLNCLAHSCSALHHKFLTADFAKLICWEQKTNPSNPASSRNASHVTEKKHHFPMVCQHYCLYRPMGKKYYLSCHTCKHDLAILSRAAPA